MAIRKVRLKNASGDQLIPNIGIPNQAGNSGKFLATNGVSYEWRDVVTGIIYRFRGSVATYADLPSQNLEAGDVYDVLEDGKNYAWTGSAWGDLGGTIDLSNYYTKSEVDGLVGDPFTAEEVETIWENI